VLDYSVGLLRDGEPVTTAERESRLSFLKNLLDTAETGFPTSLLKADTRVHIMSDGVVIRTLRLRQYIPPKFSVSLKSCPWEQVRSIDVRGREIKIDANGAVQTVDTVKKAEIDRFFESLRNLRLAGKIPPHVLIEGPTQTEAKGGKKFGWSSVAEWAIVALVCFWAVHWLRNGTDSICDGRNKFLVDQVPGTLDVLSARHPFAVGIIRDLLNDGGKLDALVQQATAQLVADNQGESFASCAMQSVAIKADPDKFRNRIADKLESLLAL
jgi:hypothetical protein